MVILHVHLLLKWIHKALKTTVLAARNLNAEHLVRSRLLNDTQDDSSAPQANIAQSSSHSTAPAPAHTPTPMLTQKQVCLHSILMISLVYSLAFCFFSRRHSHHLKRIAYRCHCNLTQLNSKCRNGSSWLINQTPLHPRSRMPQHPRT